MVPRPSNFEAKLTKKRPQADQKSSKKLVSILIQFLMDLGTRLGRFWEDFGGQVGTMLVPNGMKTRPQNQSKKRLLFGRPPERILINVWWIWGPTWGSTWAPKSIKNLSKIVLGAMLGPRSPKDVWCYNATSV